MEMLLIFQLGRADVLPVDDFGLRNGFRIAHRGAGMPTPRQMLQYEERWSRFVRPLPRIPGGWLIENSEV